MAIKRKLTLSTAQKLFGEFSIESLRASRNGVVDTTYLTPRYAIKYYERNVDVFDDARRLSAMSDAGLYVPRLLAHNNGWFLYTKLKGDHPRGASYDFVRRLAIFLRRYHALSLPYRRLFWEQERIDRALRITKRRFYRYFKRLERLEEVLMKVDGFIHGDLFCDNIVDDAKRLGVVDFIDGGGGSFVFDAAVALLGCGFYRSKAKVRLFVSVYNQSAQRKITISALSQALKVAAAYYALFRIVRDGGVKRAKELLG